MEQEKRTQPKENSKCHLSSVKIAIIILSVLIIIALIVGLTLYFVLNKSSSNSTPLDAKKRIDCSPDKTQTITQSECTERGCIWTNDKSNIIGAPLCYYPPNVGYIIDKTENKTIYLSAPKKLYAPFGPPIANLKMTYHYLGDKMVHIKIVDSDNERYEVPVPLYHPTAVNDENELMLNVSSDAKFFAFQIIRKSTKTVLIDTSIGGLVFSDQFLQIATYLPTENVYGFGENTHQTLKHDLSQFKTWPMFARDQPPESDQETRGNLYGVHPFYLVVESRDASHGVFIQNSNAQEYTLGPGPSLAYRTIGGVLDLYVFSGPSPLEVIRQYWSLIGYPTLPAYWSFGFQLSRYGYINLLEVEDVVDRNRKAQIPQDVQYIDIDYMDGERDFTLDQINFGGLPQYIDKTHSTGLKWIFIVDPAIAAGDDNYTPFAEGLHDNVYITWPNQSYVPDLNANYSDTANTTLMLGTVWPDNNTAFPDFFKNNTKNWWVNQMVQFHKLLAFDGIWIDMNEPANFATDSDDPFYWHFPSYPNKSKVPALHCPLTNKYDDPPYPTQAALFWGAETPIADKTICMIGVQGEKSEYLQYDVHNLYGWSEAEPTLLGVRGATGKRGVVLGRSTYPSSGKYVSHWLGDNASKFADLRTSVIGMLEFNMFGIPHVGADICGFNGNTTEELCLRWMQLGAFYPFSRNHNTMGAIPQDPAQWPDVAEASRISLNFRYLHLPYLYTLFYKAHTEGEIVVRPIFFEFLSDPSTLEIDSQFMWGPAIMVGVVSSENTTLISVYLPNTVWYLLYDDYGATVVPGTRVVPAPKNSTLPVFVRGGYIVPRQEPGLNTQSSRLMPFQLLVTVDSEHGAIGDMYWDDGESVTPQSYAFFQFTFNASDVENKLIINQTIIGDVGSLNLPKYFNAVEFLGLPYLPNSSTLLINGKMSEFSTEYEFSENKRLWRIYGSTLIPVGDAVVTWTNNVTNVIE